MNEDGRNVTRVEIGESLDLAEPFAGEPTEPRRIPIEDPGTVDFGKLADPDFSALDPSMLDPGASPLAGVSVARFGGVTDRVAPAEEAAPPGRAPSGPISDAPLAAGGGLVFSVDGDRLVDQPDDDDDVFSMGEPDPVVATVVSSEPEPEPVVATVVADEADPVDEDDEDDEVDLGLAARRLLEERPGGDDGTPATEMERLLAAFEDQLMRAMARRLNEPEWYLTGVEVGLESLRRLYESSRMVYANYRHRSAGVVKVSNLRVVYEQLLAFRSADDPLDRGRILIAYRRQFEELLNDMQEGRRRSRGLSATELTLYEQVAKDVTEAVNRQRTYLNLLRALDGIAKLPKMMHRTRDKKVAALLHGYEQILRSFGWEGDEGFQTKAQIVHKTRQLKDKLRRSTRHLRQVRDELYKDMPFAIDNPDVPELDLEVSKVIPFLKKNSKEGLGYLSRAFGVYEHALESSKRARAILERIEELERQNPGAAGDVRSGTGRFAIAAAG